VEGRLGIGRYLCLVETRVNLGKGLVAISSWKCLILHTHGRQCFMPRWCNGTLVMGVVAACCGTSLVL
jgi:hypothetical protein